MKWLSHVETVERSRSRTHSAQTALVLLLRHDPQLPHSRLGFLHMMQEQDYQNCRVNICQEARIDLQKWNKVMTRNDIYDLKWYWNQAGGCPRMPKGPRLAPESPKICNDFMTHDNPLNLLALQVIPNSGLKGPWTKRPNDFIGSDSGSDRSQMRNHGTKIIKHHPTYWDLGQKSSTAITDLSAASRLAFHSST
jgi:hypothetical protein